MKHLKLYSDLLQAKTERAPIVAMDPDLPQDKGERERTFSSYRLINSRIKEREPLAAMDSDLLQAKRENLWQLLILTYSRLKEREPLVATDSDLLQGNKRTFSSYGC